MPEFSFKNLTVKVGEELVAYPCPGTSFHCGPCSFRISQVCDPCTFLVSINCDACSRFASVCRNESLITCGGGSIVTCGGTIYCGGSIDPTIIYERKDLEQIRLQVKEVLKQVDAQEARQANVGRPGSVAEIDELKTKLLEAVAELDEQRAELGKDA